METIATLDQKVMALDSQVKAIIAADKQSVEGIDMLRRDAIKVSGKNSDQNMRLDDLEKMVKQIQDEIPTLGSDAAMLEGVRAKMAELMPTVNRIRGLVEGFEGSVKKVEDSRATGLKGKLPVISERAKMLGIWSVAGHRIRDDWDRDEMKDIVHIGFEPVDITWAGETLVAYRVLQDGRGAQAGKARLHKLIKHESLMTQPLSFGLEVFRIDNSPSHVVAPTHYPNQGVFAVAPDRSGRIPTRPKPEPLSFTEIADFTDWDGNALFVSRATAVVRNAKADPQTGALYVGFSLEAGDTYEGEFIWPAWVAVRPMAL